MLGGASKFLVAPNGNIGIGTTTPSALLEVSNVIPGGPANMWMTSYTNAVNPYYMARRARGTPAAPTAVLNGDGLAGFYGDGYGTTAFGSGFAGGITVQAAQNWTDAARGTQLSFSTTPDGSTASSPRMIIANSGMVGIGTTSPTSNLEVSNATAGTTFGVVTTSTFANNNGGSLYIASKARGTSATPSAVLAGDSLGGFLARGYGATTFSGTRGGIFVTASENWTDTAQGTMLNFNTTGTGTITPGTKMTLTGDGDVGIGTMFPDGALEIARTGDDTAVVATTFTNGNDAAPVFLGRSARGTQAAETATQHGDILGAFVGQGRGATNFANDAQGGVAVFAAENFTDTANGASLVFWNDSPGRRQPQYRHGASAIRVSGYRHTGGRRWCADRYRSPAGVRRRARRQCRHQRVSQAVRRNRSGRHVLVGSPVEEEHHAVWTDARKSDRAAAGALLLACERVSGRHFGNSRVTA